MYCFMSYGHTNSIADCEDVGQPLDIALYLSAASLLKLSTHTRYTDKQSRAAHTHTPLLARLC